MPKRGIRTAEKQPRDDIGRQMPEGWRRDLASRRAERKKRVIQTTKLNGRLKMLSIRSRFVDKEAFSLLELIGGQIPLTDGD